MAREEFFGIGEEGRDVGIARVDVDEGARRGELNAEEGELFGRRRRIFLVAEEFFELLLPHDGQIADELAEHAAVPALFPKARHDLAHPT